ncbi:M24 family metallopeptidase [Shigella flexneri]
MRCQQIDDAARRHYRGWIFGDYFGHNTGHAIGIEVHQHRVFHRGTPNASQACR